MNKSENISDYKTLASSNNGGAKVSGNETLKPSGWKKSKKDKTVSVSNSNLQNLSKKKKKKLSSPSKQKESKPKETEELFLFENSYKLKIKIPQIVEEDLTENKTKQSKLKKLEKRKERDKKLLGKDNWLFRNGHTLTYFGLYCFSVLVLFRPYELIPGFGFLAATAIYAALATLFIYVPTQFVTEGNVTTFSTEVKAIIAMTAIALCSIVIAKSPPRAWEVFNDTYIKAVLMFIVMVNVIRTRKRLMGMIWLSLGIAFVLSYMAIGMYSRGEISTEGYRISVDIGGIFANPNDMALHLITMFPLALTLGLASKNIFLKIFYFTVTILIVSATMVTYSRGAFLGMIVAGGILSWKLGRKYRLKVSLASIVAGLLIILLAPGNYAIRILSIFGIVPDPVGSRGQRSELLWRSIFVSGRNPWGIGIGNFEIVGVQNLGTHNAFTQVSSELGILGLLAYLIFMVSPFRKLGAIERTLFDKDETNWFYYLSIGLQASIAGYMVSSFFAAVAYNWYIYYLIAYAVAFRRIYMSEYGIEKEVKTDSLTENLLGWQLKSA